MRQVASQHDRFRRNRCGQNHAGARHPGGVYTHVADGLHEGDEPDPRRAALQRFIGEIVSLTESVEIGEAFYSPTRVAIVAAPIDTTPGTVVEWPDASVSLAGAVACTPVTDPAAVEAVNAALTRYLGDAGIEVLACRSRGRSLEQNKHASAAEDHLLALELGRAALQAAPQAQALLMPGGLWHAMHAVPILEQELGRPVLLNILSTTWAALHAAAARVPAANGPRWGKLLSSIDP